MAPKAEPCLLFEQGVLPVSGLVAIDAFAGGGGVSSGFEQATGVLVDLAINHDDDAISMHRANHPYTKHLISDICEVNPRKALGDLLGFVVSKEFKTTSSLGVGWFWASPDCTDHSKAKGGAPIRTFKRRALAWVVKWWAGTVAPLLIQMENVEEWEDWGPLIAKRKWVTETLARGDGSTYVSRRRAVVKVDPQTKKEVGVAAKGEVVPISEQALVRDKKRLGKTFRRFVQSLRDLGYVVEWRELRCSDYGAPTTRKRLFLQARRDGQPIIWPRPTHSGAFTELTTAEWDCIWLRDQIEAAAGAERIELQRKLAAKERLVRELTVKVKSDPYLKPWRTTSECINFDEPMCSVFATPEEAKAWGEFYGRQAPKRPLADNSMFRIARGTVKFVIETADPFLMRRNQGGKWERVTSERLEREATERARSAFFANLAHAARSQTGSKRWGSGVRAADRPYQTISCNDDSALITPLIAGVAGRSGQSAERSGGAPFATITSKADAAVIAPVVGPVTHSGDRTPWSIGRPLGTITCAQRGEFGLFVHYLVPRYGERPGQVPRVRSIADPYPTVVTTGNGGSLVATALVNVANSKTTGRAPNTWPLSSPLRTVATSNGFAVVGYQLTTYHGAKPDGSGTYRGGTVDAPIATIDCENRHGLVSFVVGQNNGGFALGNSGDGHPCTDPASSITGRGANQSLIGVFMDQANGGWPNRIGHRVDTPASTILTESRGHQGVLACAMAKLRGTSVDASIGWPCHTISAGGNHHSLFGLCLTTNTSGHAGSHLGWPSPTLTTGWQQMLAAMYVGRDFGESVGSPLRSALGTITAGGMGKASLVGAFLTKYYGKGIGQPLGDPLHTVPCVDRFGLVTVVIGGQRWVIYDILMRMLRAYELYLCQGFRPGYIIDHGHDSRVFTETQKVHMCGNSVPPDMAEALIRANIPQQMLVRPAKEMSRARRDGVQLSKGVALAA